jgi:hypothetical protein
MAQQLDPHCGGNFVVKDGFVYFQAPGYGLYRVPCNGKTAAQQLDENCGYLVVADDGYIYFQAGDKGLYRVRSDAKKTGTAVKLDDHCGYLAVPGDGFVYFQSPGRGLYRVSCTAQKPGTAVQLDEHCEYLVAPPGEDFVYFQAGDYGLYRVSRTAQKSGTAVQLDKHGGYLVAPAGDDFVYFQAGNYGLYRVKKNAAGPGTAVQLDENCGDCLVVPGDGFIYFQSPKRGLYRVRSNASGPGTAVRLDEHCGFLTVSIDNYVYFEAPGYGLYRVPTKAAGTGSSVQLDENCGGWIAVPDDGYVYFQGGPDDDRLYRTLIPNPFPPPPGYQITVQDQYVVNTVLDPDIDSKKAAITNLLNQANADSSDTLFLNFTSGASSGAYPDAVAGRINDPVKNYINALTVNNRLGTIVMDFPNSDFINAIIDCNSISPFSTQDWMNNAAYDNKPLSRITIPGTHDSCTSEASKMSKCQNLKLDEQLAAGIRFIDIRCRLFENKFELHHGIEYLNLNFDYVIEVCEKFLTDNSSECIIMSVKEEHDPAGNTKTFEEVFNEYAAACSVPWYRGNTIPTLSQVRGQIVLARRFYIEPGSDPQQWGLDMSVWSENATFTYP